MVQEMNDQQRALVMESMDYAKIIARRFKRSGVLIEDLEQEACEALCYASMRYNKSKGVSFVTYATPSINGSLCRYVMNHCQYSYFDKQQRMFVRMMSLDKVRGDDDGEAMNCEEIIADKPDDEAAERQRVYDIIDYVMSQLSVAEQEIITKHAGLDGDAMSIVDMASQMGVSRKVMSSRIRQIMLKMAKCAEKYNVEH